MIIHCPICDKFIIKLEGLHGHILQYHLLYTPFECTHPQCSEKLSSERLFNLHCQFKHGGVKQMFLNNNEKLDALAESMREKLPPLVESLYFDKNYKDTFLEFFYKIGPFFRHPKIDSEKIDLKNFAGVNGDSSNAVVNESPILDNSNDEIPAANQVENICEIPAPEEPFLQDVAGVSSVDIISSETPESFLQSVDVSSCLTTLEPDFVVRKFCASPNSKFGEKLKKRQASPNLNFGENLKKRRKALPNLKVRKFIDNLVDNLKTVGKIPPDNVASFQNESNEKSTDNSELAKTDVCGYYCLRCEFFSANLLLMKNHCFNAHAVRKSKFKLDVDYMEKRGTNVKPKFCAKPNVTCELGDCNENCEANLSVGEHSSVGNSIFDFLDEESPSTSKLQVVKECKFLKCSECGLSCLSISLLRHVTLAHIQKVGEKCMYRCLLCKKRFSYYVGAHISKKHSIKEPLPGEHYRCENENDNTILMEISSKMDFC